jgi:NAD(P)H dehydrogenase (quinone)
MTRTPVIYVVYYSMYGHIEKLAREVVKGVERSGATVKLFQVRPPPPQGC